MPLPTTEALHDKAAGLDQRPLAEIAPLLAEAQIAAATSVQSATDEIARGARAMAESLRAGARLHYVAAGSSGLMAAADAQELGGTFSIPAEQVRIHMAGGLPTGPEMSGETEDATAGLESGLTDLDPADTVIAVSASGQTPYTLAAAEIAKRYDATLVAIANNPDAPLLARADHPICLATPPEMVSGSTRLGAGTAQKIALNMLSTLMAIALGHVHDGMMVNLRADNAKLRARAAGIVCRVANVNQTTAAAALAVTGGDVKPAILVAARSMTSDQAQAMLKQTNDNLRAALARPTLK